MRILIALILVLAAPNIFCQFETDQDPPLLKAVRANNIKEVKLLVEAGAPVNLEDHFVDDPLTVAITNDHREIALYLLSKGAESRNGFYSAVLRGDIKWVKTLLTYKFYDDEAIIPAVEQNNLEMVKTLIEEGFPVHFQQKRRTGLFKKHYVSPIEISIDNHFDLITYELVKAGAPLEEAFYSIALFEQNDLGMKIIDMNKDLNELLLLSAKAGNIALLEYSVKKGADPATKNKEGKNALLLAAEYGERDMYWHCVNKLGLSPNSLTIENENALMLSCRFPNLALLNELLALNQNLEFQNNSGETALFYAQRSTESGVFQLFLNKPFNIDHLDKQGNTVLLKAAFSDNMPQVRMLLEKGAKIDVKNKSGQNIISGLINGYNYDSELIISMIDKGVDVNVKSVYGVDIAFKAIERNDIKLLEKLYEKGVSIDGRDNSNQRPSLKNIDLMKFVIDHGGDPNAKDSWSNTYLCTALELNDVEFASYLIKKGADINKPACFMGEFLLMEAIKKDNLTFVQFLVESNADLYVKNTWSKNAMELALERNNQDIVNYLRSKGAMTKDELNKREVERLKEMQKLTNLIEKKDLSTILHLLNKYPESVFSEDEKKALVKLSAEMGSVELFQICLEHMKWKVNDPVNFEQQTILHLAVINKQPSFTILIVNKGGKINQEDAFGKTPVDYAKNKEIKSYFKKMKKTDK